MSLWSPFLKNGKVFAIFKFSGKFPYLRLLLDILSMAGPSISILIRKISIGVLSWPVLDSFKSETISVSSYKGTSQKLKFSWFTFSDRNGTWLLVLIKLFAIDELASEKYLLKLSAISWSSEILFPSIKSSWTVLFLWLPKTSFNIDQFFFGFPAQVISLLAKWDFLALSTAF